MRKALEARFANGYCSRVGGMVRGWAKLCTCLMGSVWLFTWRSFANCACYREMIFSSNFGTGRLILSLRIVTNNCITNIFTCLPNKDVMDPGHDAHCLT